MELTVGDLAARLGACCEGNPAVRITGVAGLREARRGDVSFLAQPRYAGLLAHTGASALVVFPSFDQPFDGVLIRVPDPDAAFQRIAGWFAAPAPAFPAGVHPSAVVSPEAVLAEDIGVGPQVVIEAGVRIGAGCRIHAGCYLGPGVSLGEGCELRPLVSIQHHCRLGRRVLVHNGTVIGSDGFGYTQRAEGTRVKIPQVGVVDIGDDVEIGANVTIDRARFGVTRIGNGVKIDNLVQVAHNVIVEDNVVLVAQVGLAGSCVIGKGATIGGQVGVAGHLVVGEGAMVGGQSGITKDVPAGSYVVGFPAVPQAKFARAQAHLHRIPQLQERIAALEQQVRELQQQIRPAAPPRPPAAGS